MAPLKYYKHTVLADTEKSLSYQLCHDLIKLTNVRSKVEWADKEAWRRERVNCPSSGGHQDNNRHMSHFSVFKMDWHAVLSGLQVSFLVSWPGAWKVSSLTLCYPVISLSSLSLCSDVIFEYFLADMLHQLRVSHTEHIMQGTLNDTVEACFMYWVNSSVIVFNVLNQSCATQY